jgi:hypothetical protein
LESRGARATARPSAAAKAAITKQAEMGFLNPALAAPDARVASGTAQTKQSITTGVRANVAENMAYQARIDRGEHGVLAPGGSNVKGPDYVTAKRLPNGNYEIVVVDTKSRVNASSSFKKIRSSLSRDWQDAVSDALTPGRLDFGNPILEQAIRDAWAQDRVRIARDTVDFSPEGQGKWRLDN